jgi:hypothetical protein
MSDFESELAKTPLRPAPADWRGEILRAARSAAPEAVPSSAAWWRRWLAPQPLTLAAAWVVTATLRLATPAESPAPRTSDLAQMKAQIRAQQKLLAELLNPPGSVPAPAPPRQQGAWLQRRKHEHA